MKSNKIYISVIVVLAALLIGSLSLNVALLMREEKPDSADAAYNAPQDIQSTSKETREETTEETSVSAFDPVLVGDWLSSTDIISVSEDGSFVWTSYGYNADGDKIIGFCTKGFIKDYVMIYTDKYTIEGRQVGPSLPEVTFYSSIDDIPADEWETGLNEEGYRISLRGDTIFEFIGKSELTGLEYTITGSYNKK